MTARSRWLAWVLVVPLVGGTTTALADGNPDKEKTPFATLKAPGAAEAKAQAAAWLQNTGKTDAAAKAAFEKIWSDADRPVFDRVVQTLVLGDPAAEKLLKDARDPAYAAPQELPALLKDMQRSSYLRANLGLAYAKALSQRRVYEEALDTFKALKVEQVVDPSSFLFHKAVAEHALTLKEDATRSILRLLDDAQEVPERYKMVSILMAFDMQSWKDKDLGDIARKMQNIERRLDLSRGGPKTQKIQKEVVARLDELIKQLENQCNGGGNCNGGACPNGGNPGSGTPNAPQRDSLGGANTGPGNIDQKKLEGMAKQWGKLPEKERAQAMQELTRDMPPKFREVIESYFKKLAASDGGRP